MRWPRFRGRSVNAFQRKGADVLRNLAIALCLGACAGTQVSLGPASEHLVPHALRETERAFFEGSAPVVRAHTELAAQAGPQREEQAALVSEDLFDFDETPYELGDAIALRISRRWQRRLSGPAVLWLEAGGSATRLRYRLPEGLGILRDPIDLRINTLKGDMAFGLALEGGPRTFKGRLHLGAGASVARVRTSVTSALLDVHHSTFLTEPFVTVGGEISSHNARLFAHVRENRDSGYAVVTGFGLTLP